jgi:O-antigen ligase
VKSFRTYVSDNPEKSTTHNYFLLQLAEQGIPGFLLFAILSPLPYSPPSGSITVPGSPEVRRVVLAATPSPLLSSSSTCCSTSWSKSTRLVSVFFICLALLIRAESWTKEDNEQLAVNS